MSAALDVAEVAEREVEVVIDAFVDVAARLQLARLRRLIVPDPGAFVGVLRSWLFLDARAAPVTITTPFMNLENRAINSLGFAPGQFPRIGANSVVPNGNAGTTGFGTTVNLANQQTVTRTINLNPGPIIPNFFSVVQQAEQADDGCERSDALTASKTAIARRVLHLARPAPTHRRACDDGRSWGRR